jgi:hypothetical protein
MSGDSVECYNCGRANPAWAQVCRSCGVPMRAGAASAQSSGPIPTDRDSLISIASTLAAIAAAVVLGLVLAGMIPEAPPVAEISASPDPSLATTPSGSALPSAAQSAAASAEPSAPLLGTIAFGTGLDGSQAVTGETDTFGPGSAFCHSRRLRERFRVDQIQEEVLRVEEDGSLTEVQPRSGSNLSVDPEARVAGFCAPGGSDALIGAWGAGEFVMRDYRRTNRGPQLIAEGRFTFTE